MTSAPTRNRRIQPSRRGDELSLMAMPWPVTTTRSVPATSPQTRPTARADPLLAASRSSSSTAAGGSSAGFCREVRAWQPVAVAAGAVARAAVRAADRTGLNADAPPGWGAPAAYRCWVALHVKTIARTGSKATLDKIAPETPPMIDHSRRPRRLLRVLLLGSTAAYVAEHAHCDGLVVVRPDGHEGTEATAGRRSDENPNRRPRALQRNRREDGTAGRRRARRRSLARVVSGGAPTSVGRDVASGRVGGNHHHRAVGLVQHRWRRCRARRAGGRSRASR